MSQLQLFIEPTTAASTVPTVETVREKLQTILDALRMAEGSGRSAKEIARWKLVVPQMADWLPSDEREALTAEFQSLVYHLDEAA